MMEMRKRYLLIEYVVYWFQRKSCKFNMDAQNRTVYVKVDLDFNNKLYETAFINFTAISIFVMFVVF